MINKTLCMLALLLCFAACSNKSAGDAGNSQSADSTQNAMAEENLSKDPAKVLIHTTEGDITVLLYGDTPRHRDNFLKLVKENFYDSTLFHRVIRDFMVQAGDPDSKTAKPGQQLGAGDPGYTIPAEIKYPTHFHKRGALSAARTGDAVNPQKASSGSQFYIVTGEVYDPATLESFNQRQQQQQVSKYFDQLARQNMAEVERLRNNNDRDGLMALQNRLVEEARQMAAANPVTMPAEVIEAYTTIGGTPHLDGDYTVFGEVLEGMDVVDRIQQAQTDGADRPLTDIRILSTEILP